MSPVPPTLLIVDDDRALAQMLGWAFEDLGYAVWTAADCGEALAAARVMAFDYVLLDCRLPDGDGPTLSRALAATMPDTKIVLMSVDRTAARRADGDPGAAVAFVEKPIPIHRLDRQFRGDRAAPETRRMVQ